MDSIGVSMIVLVSAGLFGIFLVEFLTANPKEMNRYLLGTVVTLGISFVLLFWKFQNGLLVILGVLALLAAIAGYGWMAKNVLSREDKRTIPELVRKPDDPGNGHTAVVYFTHGEPETYDPSGWINQFREFDEQEVAFIPFLVRPFFLCLLRKKYLKVGKSKHRSTHQKMIAALERAFREQGDLTTKFYLSFLDDVPRPDAAAVQALNESASQIVVSEVFVTDSNHTAEGKKLIKDVLDRFPQLPVRYTGPLHDSKTLQKMFVERANQNNGFHDKEKIGVLLVGHGQPDEWDIEWPTETEQELAFRYNILHLFEEHGYNPEKIALAWMEFKHPRPAEKVQEFANNGVKEVLYFPAAISADGIHSQYDIPEMVHKAKGSKQMVLKNLGAWNDDPLVIKAIQEKIQAAMNTFEN